MTVSPSIGARRGQRVGQPRRGDVVRGRRDLERHHASGDHAGAAQRRDAGRRRSRGRPGPRRCSDPTSRSASRSRARCRSSAPAASPCGSARPGGRSQDADGFVVHHLRVGEHLVDRVHLRCGHLEAFEPLHGLVGRDRQERIVEQLTERGEVVHVLAGSGRREPIVLASIPDDRAPGTDPIISESDAAKYTRCPSAVCCSR